MAITKSKVIMEHAVLDGSIFQITSRNSIQTFLVNCSDLQVIKKIIRDRKNLLYLLYQLYLIKPFKCHRRPVERFYKARDREGRESLIKTVKSVAFYA